MLRLLRSDPSFDTLVLTPDAARTVAARVGTLTKERSYSVVLRHSVQAVTRVAGGRVLVQNNGSVPTHTVTVNVDDQRGRCEFSSLDDETLRTAVARAEALARALPWRRKQVIHPTIDRRPIPESHIWKASTVAAMARPGASRTDAIAEWLAPISRTPFIGAGVLGLMARAMCVFDTDGPEAYYRETDTLCTVSARARDGSSSGWAAVAARDWDALHPSTIAQRAIDVAERSAAPVAIEPGRYTVILSSTACGQLIATLSAAFSAVHTDAGMTPFSDPTSRNKLGQRVIDERLSLWSDPDDALGGYMPFWGDDRDLPQSDILVGDAVPAMRWIDRGVLTNLAYGYGYALAEGKEHNRFPHSMHLEAERDVQRSTVEEMIAGCDMGIYVNRFTHITETDGLSAQCTGVTRDGCFLVRGGKITKAVKNLRFLDSPLFLLNKVLAIGVAERVVVDDALAAGASFPVIAPPIMARDFRFTALSDAI